MNAYGHYRQELIKQLWNYSAREFCDQKFLFDKPLVSNPKRPPVFKSKEYASNNILTKPGLSTEGKDKVIESILEGKKQHRWFRSMLSSQALTFSVFGNLKFYGKTNCLAELKGDDGKSLFIRTKNGGENLNTEKEFGHNFLGELENRCTSVDVFFEGAYRIAVECKLAEREIGACSRPKLKPSHKEYCDGRYALQMGRSDRCALQTLGIRYWKHIPHLFDWSENVDPESCSLRTTYQLVRNVLAACMDSDGKVNPENGHVVLVYDERNPEFQSEGKGWKTWQKVRESLKYPSLIQKCSWQQIVKAMSADSELSWLVESLQEKYGFKP